MEWTAVKKISTSDFQIEAGGTKIGEDILLYVKGGEKPHIGCTVIAVPRPSLSGNGQTSATSSVLNLTGHKDESLCRTLAEMVCCASGKNVACSGGFHMDQITLQQIQEVEAAVRKLGEFLKKEHHGMFLSMPVPMQIYAEVESDLPCPLTVREGRNWITQVMQKARHDKLEQVCHDREQLLNESYHDEMNVEKHDRAFEKNNEFESTKTDDFTQNSSTDINIDTNEVNSKSNSKLHKTLNTLRSKIPHMSKEFETPAIQVKDVWFRYEKDGRDVVQDLNLEVKQGEFYALVGGNGTGKSTTLSLISRVRAPYRGKILLNGVDIRRNTDTQLYRGYLGVLPQNPQSMFIRKTVREDLYSIIGGAKEKKSPEYTASMKKAEAIEGIVSLTRLEGLLDRHPYDLSGGEQQRLALAKVLLLQPRLLLMDEPTKGLDAEYKQELGEILKKLQEHGFTIFMISHEVEFVADRRQNFLQETVSTLLLQTVWRDITFLMQLPERRWLRA